MNLVFKKRRIDGTSKDDPFQYLLALPRKKQFAYGRNARWLVVGSPLQ
jgi:hypothetical protein